MMNPSSPALPCSVTFLSSAATSSSQAPTATGRASRGRSAVARLRPAPRRIWELDPARVALVAGGLLGGDDVRSLLTQPIGFDAEADVLLGQVVRACSRRCSLAEDVEAAMHERSGWLAALVDRSPMIGLADWWSRHREELTGAQTASLLWRLSCDPRPHLEKLASRIADDLCIRAVQLVRDRRPCADARAPRSVDATSCERAAL